MIAESEIISNFKLSEENKKREKRIISKLNLKKLPFKLSLDKICDLNLAMVRHSRVVLKYTEDRPGIKWCFSSIKKLKVFLVIFESNELGEEVYKERISNKLPEYSYKTIAQIVDEGVTKGFFLKLEPRIQKTKDLKIRNIRPSEDIIIGFINWKIDMLASLTEFKKKI
jgi:hypothetical protein|tara:strand:- start:402 stop:908 length:507 start_codon:yes stop_codon:yes gene_type:complete